MSKHANATHHFFNDRRKNRKSQHFDVLDTFDFRSQPAGISAFGSDYVFDDSASHAKSGQSLSKVTNRRL